MVEVMSELLQSVSAVMTLMIHPSGAGSRGHLLPVHEHGESCASAQLPCHLTSQGGNHLTVRFPTTIVAPMHLQDTLP